MTLPIKTVPSQLVEQQKTPTKFPLEQYYAFFQTRPVIRPEGSAVEQQPSWSAKPEPGAVGVTMTGSDIRNMAETVSKKLIERGENILQDKI